MTNLDPNLRIVTIGGGTGSFTLLSVFKRYFKHITAIVNMADNGGSTGMLRDELGVLPPGDVRQCLVALSQAPELRELFDYRFAEGSLDGQSFGNLFLSAAEKVGKDFESAVKLAGHILRIQGNVVPVTTTDAELVLSWDDDSEPTRGEYTIGHLDFAGKSKPHITLDPVSTITESARQAIAKADCVVIAPGNLYGSLAPALIVDGMREALATTDATICYVCNLVTKPHQTDGFSVTDYAAEVERFVGSPILDFVLYNTDRPEAAVLDKYVHAGELLVAADTANLSAAHYQAVGLSLIARGEVRKEREGDLIAASRSFIRHDAEAVVQALHSILNTI